MAGIYLHIPFCKQACHYCDFHFSTSLSYSQQMTDALVREIGLQKEYLGKDTIETIYFGGGTPSILTQEQLRQLIDEIYQLYSVNEQAEITLEANPDDLSFEKLKQLKSIGINRLSIGIQSFNASHLKYLNRAHNVEEAMACVNNARDIGFGNISIDLIYGIPFKDHSVWINDLAQCISLRPEHISSYCLTIEEKTVFGHWLKKGKIKRVTDEYAAQQFEMLLATLTDNNYEQYEISNFAQPGRYSQHNSSYWKQKKYLGIGPSAHSFNGKSRQHNIAHNLNYIKSIEKGNLPFQLDILSKEDSVNEYILTSLRTIWGTNLGFLKKEYGVKIYEKRKDYIDKLIKNDLVSIHDSVITLTNKGKLLADKIAEDLFIE